MTVVSEPASALAEPIADTDDPVVEPDADHADASAEATTRKPAPPLDNAAPDAEETVDEPGSDHAGATAEGKTRNRTSPQRRATIFCLVVVAALAALAGWWGLRLHQAQQVQTQRSQFLQAARQGALNLTTIDWQHADADVHRILDGATGEFYNDFAQRAKPFIEVLQQAKASTVGKITEAGLESESADGAQVLVALTVQTSNAGEPDPVPRAWRMRISVHKVGDQVKVSNVGFVS